MKTTVNTENDKFFLKLVKQGKLRVTRSGKVFNTKTGKQLAKNSKSKYAAIGWKITGTKKVMHMLVHRLVYLVHGDEVLGNRIVNHKDGVKKNNHINNLEPSTYSENNKHAYEIGLNVVSEKARQNFIQRSKEAKGELNASSKVTNNEAFQIRVLYKSGKYSQTKLGHRFGIKGRTVSDIILRKTYVVPFKFSLNKRI